MGPLHAPEAPSTAAQELPCTKLSKACYCLLKELPETPKNSVNGAEMRPESSISIPAFLRPRSHWHGSAHFNIFLA
eukprot:1083767-Pelagomonas_calceolata.AAC.1